MEVFVRNLPQAGVASKKAFRTQLQPVMRALEISDHAYHCEKPRGKRYGHITFLSQLDGQKFLGAHGEVRNSRNRAWSTSRLQILQTPVYCSLSNRPPNDNILRGLARKADEMRKAPISKKESEPSFVFKLRSLMCGHYTYLDDKLTFIPEANLSQEATAIFAKWNLTIKLIDTNQQIVIPLRTIQELIWAPRGEITVTLDTVPHFFAVPETSDAIDQMSAEMGQILIHHDEPRLETKARLTSLRGHHSNMASTCLIYHLMAIPDDEFNRRIRKLDVRNNMTITRYDILIQSHADPQYDMVEQSRSLEKKLAGYMRSSTLPFSVLYQLQALATNGYLHPRVVIGLLDELRQHSDNAKRKGEKPISGDAIKAIFNDIPWPSPDCPAHYYQVEELMDLIKSKEQTLQGGLSIPMRLSDDNQNMTLIYRVDVTPTSVFLRGPELDNKNRILRKFPNHQDHFIRLQFCEENGGDLRFNFNTNFEEIYQRFRDILISGLPIAGRTYSFLGGSGSSLRARSVWLVAPFLDDRGSLQTHRSIINALGDFAGISSPARCAARIGQAFTETPFSLSLDDHNIFVTQIPDVKSQDGENVRVFSDGVGTFSEPVMRAIWSVLPQKKSAPTCFQFRYAGSKGMLALDSGLEGSCICIRPSMTKFESQDVDYLEICDMASRPIPLVLNRQMIKILEDMGTNNAWFSSMQWNAVQDLRGVTANAYNTAKFLRRQHVGNTIKIHELIKLSDSQGFEYRKDRFLRSVIEALVLGELRLLKHKARIPVKKGIALFGIMDETGLLEEGQVYVTFDCSNMDLDRQAPAPGPCEVLVTRSPALHPGDIQLATNVVPPEDSPLRDLANCIVFSAKGKRDLPGQLSGGDLDGDIYHIIWDKDAMRTKHGLPLNIFPPADYPMHKQITLPRPVVREDMAEFFVEFMKADQLGVIATRHMILSDHDGAGTLAPACIKLAELHSRAVDFPKTGEAVNWRELPPALKFRPDL